MAKKYVLEIGGPSMYIGNSVEARKLYSTYEKAKEEYNKILHKNYTDEELADEDLVDECTYDSGESELLDVWHDDECDCYLSIYAVEEVA